MSLHPIAPEIGKQGHEVLIDGMIEIVDVNEVVCQKISTEAMSKRK